MNELNNSQLSRFKSKESSTQTERETAERPRSEMGFLDHLGELRTRLFYSIIAILVGAICCYNFSEEAFGIMSQPFLEAFEGQQLIGTGPADAFMLRIKISLFLGFLLALPVIFYQFWLFVSPGLHYHEKRLILPFISISSLLFLTGVWFCHYVVLPFTFGFFQSQYEVFPSLISTIRVQEYVGLLVKMLLAFGMVFETPVLAFFLGRIGLIDAQDLINSFRYITVAIFVIAAILTPPDIISQLLLAAPLIALYGLSILIVKFSSTKKRSDQ